MIYIYSLILFGAKNQFLVVIERSIEITNSFVGNNPDLITNTLDEMLIVTDN